MPDIPIFLGAFTYTYSIFLLFYLTWVFYLHGSISICIQLPSFGAVHVPNPACPNEDDLCQSEDSPQAEKEEDEEEEEDPGVNSEPPDIEHRNERQRVLDRYTDTLGIDAAYYDPPEMYYCGRAATAGPRGGYGPPYEYYSGAWRDGYGHDVTDPPFYARDDETGCWYYSWPGRGRGASW
ncbi:hypothetical protein DV735_g3416, partial [Chaetothyriales sp. CBS 134920]